MLTAEALRRQLRYDPDTGLFWWLIPGRKRRLHQPAGSQRKDRRWVIRVDGTLYLAHQLAWLWMTGVWIAEIDHANLDPGDNRWCNLREATRSQNAANRGAQRNNKLGVKGVQKHQSGFRARIWKLGHCVDCGVYPTVEQASAAYAKAAAELHGAFARTQ